MRILYGTNQKGSFGPNYPAHQAEAMTQIRTGRMTPNKIHIQTPDNDRKLTSDV